MVAQYEKQLLKVLNIPKEALQGTAWGGGQGSPDWGAGAWHARPMTALLDASYTCCRPGQSSLSDIVG